MSVSPITLHTVLPHVVELGTVWHTWVSAPELICTGYSQGSGQVIGDATLVRRLGNVAQPGAALSPVAIGNDIGKFVRVSLVESGTNVPVWYGVITGDSLQDEGAPALGIGTGIQILHCASIAHILSQIVISRGVESRYATDASGSYSAVINPGYLPPFNQLIQGDRETTATTVDGKTVYPHRRWRGPDATWTEWGADFILSNILAVHARGITGLSPSASGTGPVWSYNDEDSALGFVLRDIDFNGMSVLDAINTIANQRRGLTWNTVVNSSTGAITIRVWSIAATAVTMPGYTLPASSHASAIDLSSGAEFSDVRLSRDASTCYDVITVCGARPWVGMTLAWSASPSDDRFALTKDWTATEETAWGLVAGNDTLDHTDYRHVWKRFRIRSEWLGRQFSEGAASAYGLPFAISEDGDGNITADQTFSPGLASSASPQSLEITRDLPCSEGFSDEADGDRQTPRVFCIRGGTYESWNGEDSIPAARVTADSIPPRLTIEPGDGPDLSAALEDGATLLVTCGIRGGRPLMYRWARPSGSRPRNVARSIVSNLTDCEYWEILPNTVTGAGTDNRVDPPITTDGLRTTGSTPLVIRDDRPTLRSTLALMVSYYSTPSVALNFTRRDGAKHDTWCEPGTLVTDVTLGIGVISANAVVTRRVVNLTEEGWGTSYECARLIPDVEAIR